MTDDADGSRLAACSTPFERREFLAQLFMSHRGRLRSMVEVRLDPRLRARVDPSDILQDAFLDAARRVDEFLRDRPMPLFLWLRRITAQRLVDICRFHLGAEARAAGKEVHLAAGPELESSTEALTSHLLARSGSPLEAMLREETAARVREALEALEPMDREILALRHFEELSNAETARVLGIEESAAGVRFFRALKRLKQTLEGLGLRLEREP